MTIRRKLYLMLCFVLLVIAGMTVVTYLRSSTILSDITDAAGMNLAERSVSSIDNLFDTYRAVLDSTANTIAHNWSELGGDKAKISDYLSSELEAVRSSGLKILFFGIESNGDIADINHWQAPSGYDSRTRVWFKDGVAAQGKFSISKATVSTSSNESTVFLSRAVFDKQGKLLGVLGSVLPIDELLEIVANTKLFGKGYSVLLQNDGLALITPNKQDIMKNNYATNPNVPKSLQEVVRRMIRGERGFQRYEYLGTERQIFFLPTNVGLAFGIVFPVQEIDSIIHRLTFVLIVMAIIAFVVTGVVIFFINRGISRSIQDIQKESEKLSQGDLTVHYNDTGKDELGDVCRMLNATVESLRGSMTEIQTASDTTAHQSETLAALSEETLASMEEVSASMERIIHLMEENSSTLQTANTSVEEIASGAQASAEAATTGAEGAAQVSEKAEHSSEELGKALKDIQRAEEFSKDSIDRLRGLERSVEAIAGFVSTITSIADQTNLLALNAAIEAARAGEAGRGFAVVAEEVRKLAEESARAAQQVNELIGGLQEHSKDSIVATEKTGELLQSTTKKTVDTQERLEDALAALSRLTDSIQNVAAVSQEQAASSAEMANSIQQVTETTEQTAESGRNVGSATRETTEAAESIAGEAQRMAETSERLQGIVRRFKLVKETETDKAALPQQAK